MAFAVLVFFYCILDEIRGWSRFAGAKRFALRSFGDGYFDGKGGN